MNVLGLPFFHYACCNDLLDPVRWVVLSLKKLPGVIKEALKNLAMLKLACFRDGS
jgi:hypothetical protein